MHLLRWWSIVCGLLAFVLPLRPLAAELDLTRAFSEFAAEAARTRGVVELPSFLLNRERGRVTLLAERIDHAAKWPEHATRLPGEWCALELSPAEALELHRQHPGFRYDWSPGRRLLLDRADGWVRASSARARFDRSGRGVVVGIVDSGIDVAHADFRRADGSTRVRWLLDFGRPALGRHPELEAALGCDRSIDCAVYEGADIDELLNNETPLDEPRDALGHGTHVASLAAGNGLSAAPARYVGVAPEAELIVARVTSTGSAIADADIVRATAFVFERAEDLGLPAVVNLSLGSDFGPHDGSSALERALADLVGAGRPGRAIVLAAGNSAGLYVDASDDGAAPLGIHTEVHLPRQSSLTLPLLTPLRPRDDARLDVWLEMRPGDAVSVGLELDGRTLIAPVSAGETASSSGGSFDAGVHNRDPDQGRTLHPSANVLIRGIWPESSQFALRLEGHGSVSVWVQGLGALDPSRGPGPLIAGGLKTGTINVPASHPLLIAVGATLNRSDWTDFDGHAISLPSHGALRDAPADTTAFFSSAGPNSLGTMKPDLVAPGANVIGALSELADPRASSGAGMFGADEHCAPRDECNVVDDFHAVASGTSLAAPLVTGAIALLLEGDPELTQEQLRGLLQAGARPLEGVLFSEQQAGIGALDIDGALSAQREVTRPSERLPSVRSWLAAAAPTARPDPAWPVFFHAELRDEDGRICDGFDPARLELGLRRAKLVEPLSRIAPGLFRFAVAAPRDSGGQSLRVALHFDGREIVHRELSIEVDAHFAAGPVSTRGGCGFALPTPSGPTQPSRYGAVLFGALACVFALRRRAYRHRPRFLRPRSPGSR